MKTIWKFELSVTDVQRVPMPMGAVILTAREQHVSERSEVMAREADVPMLWALVDPDAIKVDRIIGIVGTGNPAPDPDEDGGIYVGTAICGPFVWHIFDGGEGQLTRAG